MLGIAQIVAHLMGKDHHMHVLDQITVIWEESKSENFKRVAVIGRVQ